MNSDGDSPAGRTDAGGDAEESIRALIDQESETSSEFMTRVRQKIHRRTTVSQLTSYSWNLPKIVLTEMLSVLQHLFSALSGRKES